MSTPEGERIEIYSNGISFSGLWWDEWYQRPRAHDKHEEIIKQVTKELAKPLSGHVKVVECQRTVVATNGPSMNLSMGIGKFAQQNGHFFTTLSARGARSSGSASYIENSAVVSGRMTQPTDETGSVTDRRTTRG